MKHHKNPIEIEINWGTPKIPTQRPPGIPSMTLRSIGESENPPETMGVFAKNKRKCRSSIEQNQWFPSNSRKIAEVLILYYHYYLLIIIIISIHIYIPIS